MLLTLSQNNGGKKKLNPVLVSRSKKKKKKISDSRVISNAIKTFTNVLCARVSEYRVKLFLKIFYVHTYLNPFSHRTLL